MTGAAGRPVIAYADGADAAAAPPGAIAELAGIGDHEVLLGWTPEPLTWHRDPNVRGRTFMAGYALAAAVAEGRVEYVPARLSAVPRLVEGALRPTVAVVPGVRRGSGFGCSGTVGWGPAVARAADQVVVEIDGEGADLGGPAIEGNIVATIERPAAPPAGPAGRDVDASDLRIGRSVAALLPDDATLQLGPGGIADAIVAALDRPVAIWSGLVTDRVAELSGRGLLRSPAVAAYTWGGEPVRALAAAGGLRLIPVEECHDPGGLATIDRFVACNTALQVGLDGSVNVERVNGRCVAGIGGHADFCYGATRARGGLSVIALRATTRRGMSTIVPRVEVVSTPRSDVELVVTEYGIADLRGVGDAERGERIMAVAAPEHRAELAAALGAEGAVTP